MDPEAAERVAEGALGTVVGLLEGGAPVLSGTREPAGQVVAPVADRRSAGRRLARAVNGSEGARTVVETATTAGGGAVDRSGARP